jgi:hypothetical protein
MKIQTLALLVVAGSMIASGYVIGPAPGATVATIATTAAQAIAAVPDKLAPTPQPTTKVRMTRPPVPLQVGSHDQYFTSPPADAVATDTQTAAATMGTTGINSTSTIDGKPLDDQAQTNIVAKAAIEQDGYRNVRALSMGADGTWHGRAMRGSTEITVSVDANGSVSAD